MKVAIDSGPLTSGHKVRGVGVYVRELVKALDEITKKQNNIKIDAFEFSTNHQSLITNHYDIVHYTSFHPYLLTLPIKKPTKIVITIHDTIPLIYPKHYPPGIKGKLNFLINKQLLKRIDGVIVPSETSKKDVVRFLGVSQEKIRVIYEAPRSIFKPNTKREAPSSAYHRSLITARNKYDLPKTFALYVGDVNYNKNLLILAEACNIVKIPLVLVGKQTSDENIELSHVENQPFAEFLKKHGKNENILRLGYVRDEELVAIYNLASVYCQPSYYEGFGLSILEAMAAGTPVVAARTQALVEIAGGACLFADPKDPKDIASKLKEVIYDTQLKNQLIETGKVLVKNYSWEKTARDTLRVYRNILSKITYD